MDMSVINGSSNSGNESYKPVNYGSSRICRGPTSVQVGVFINYVEKRAGSGLGGVADLCRFGINALVSRLQVGERVRPGSVRPDVFFDN